MAPARILIVEDEAIVALDVQKTFQTLGYDVPAIAFSGEEALQKTEELHPDVVLMDILLKGTMDGIEAAREIHERFGIPSIFMTGYSEEIIEQLNAGKPCLYVIKPFFVEKELHKTILKALKEHRGINAIEDRRSFLRGCGAYPTISCEECYDWRKLKSQKTYDQTKP